MKPLHELDALCAEKVAGYKPPTHPDTIARRESAQPFVTDDMWLLPNGAMIHQKDILKFSTDPAAVLGLLERAMGWECDNFGGGDTKYRVNVWMNNTDAMAQGKAPAFALAATLALLNAHGVETE